MNIVEVWGPEFYSQKKLDPHWDKVFLEHIKPGQAFTIGYLAKLGGRQYVQAERAINRPGFVEILTPGKSAKTFFYQQEFFVEAQEQGNYYYPLTLGGLIKQVHPRKIFLEKEAMKEVHPLKSKRAPKTKAKEIPTQEELNILEDKNVQKIVISVLEHSNVSTLIKVINHVYETETQFHNSP